MLFFMNFGYVSVSMISEPWNAGDRSADCFFIMIITVAKNRTDLQLLLYMN